MTIAALFLILFVYKALFFLAVWRAGKFVWAQALIHSPAGHMTNNNMREVFGSPVIWAALVVMLVFLALWLLLEISIVITGIDRAARRRLAGRRAGGREKGGPAAEFVGEICGLFQESLGGIRHILSPTNLPLLLFVVLAFPFTDLLLTSQFISQFVSLKYLSHHIMGNAVWAAVFWLVVLVLVFWIVEWLFVFHYFILERCSFPEAVRKSMALVRGRQVSGFFQVARRRFAAGFEMYLAGFLGAGAALVVFRIANEMPVEAALAEQISYRYIYLPAFIFIYSCIMTFVHYDALTLVYRDFLRASEEAGSREDYPAAVVISEAEKEAETPEPDGEAPDRKRRPSLQGDGVWKKGWRFHREGRFLAGGMAVSIMVFSLFTAAMLVHTSLVDESVRNLTEITAHRGYSARAPENTLPAFELAADCGKADYAELDVRQTADGVLVVTHDASLKRCTGRNARVSELTYAEISALDAAVGYRGPGAADFSGVTIPTFREVLKLCQGKIRLNVEIKGADPELVLKTLRAIKEYGMDEECMISSSRYSVLQKVKELDENMKCGYIMSVGAGRYYDLPAADFFSMEAEFVTREIVNELHLRGREIHVWTVNDTGTLENMLQLGVDNIITDEPELIFDYMEEMLSPVLEEEFLIDNHS